MKLIPYNPACHEAGWPLATVTLRITLKGHEVDESDPHSCCSLVGEFVIAIQETTMIIALPQWLVKEGEAHPDFLGRDGAFIRNADTAHLFAGWAEPIATRCHEAGFCGDCGVADVVEVLCIRPVCGEADE